MKRASCALLALLVVVLLTPDEQAEAQRYYRQYYGNGSKRNGWHYHPKQKAWSTYYYYRPRPGAAYKYHYAYYYPSRPRYVYYYNHYKKVYWGRCPTTAPYNYQLLAENDRYIGQGDEKRPRRIDELDENAFGRGEMEGMPRIPEADNDDPSRMDPPPPPPE